MTITAKLSAALFAIFILLLGGAWLALNSEVGPGFQRLENEAHARDVARIEANLEAMKRELQARTLDYAHWTDAYVYVQGQNPNFIADTFPPSWFSEYGADLLVFVDDRGRRIWSGVTDTRGVLAEDHGEAASAIADVIPTLRGTESKSGVIWTEQGPLMFVATRATRTNGTGQPRGAVIIGRRIAEASLRQQMQVDITLINAAAAPRALAARMARGEPATWADHNATFSLLPLRGARGSMPAWVMASSDRSITAFGGQSIQLAILSFAGILSCAIAILWLLLRRMVIARIARLERHFDAQSTAMTLLPEDAVRGDEISKLTAAYNALVLRLQSAMERERAAELAREAAAGANRMKSAFLANISHELRTPLNAVIGYTELVEEDLADAGVAIGGADLQRIRGAARHLLMLINEILDLSRLEAGRLEIAPASFCIEEMIDAVVSTIGPLVSQNRNTLDIDVPSDLGNAYSDELRWRQCLINLLANACKFTQDGHITLRVRRVRDAGGDCLSVEVKDSGCGMTEAQLARVFEPFVQADADISRRFGGSGLGLSITKNLVALLGGKVAAVSAPGLGSTFVITAPALLEEPAGEAQGERLSALEAA